jgi:hypothetical protein
LNGTAGTASIADLRTSWDVLDASRLICLGIHAFISLHRLCELAGHIKVCGARQQKICAAENVWLQADQLARLAAVGRSWLRIGVTITAA